MGFYGAITSAWYVTRRYSGRASVRSTGTKWAQNNPNAKGHFYKNCVPLSHCSIYAGLRTLSPLVDTRKQRDKKLIKNLIKKAQKLSGSTRGFIVAVGAAFLPLFHVGIC